MVLTIYEDSSTLFRIHSVTMKQPFWNWRPPAFCYSYASTVHVHGPNPRTRPELSSAETAARPSPATGPRKTPSGSTLCAAPSTWPPRSHSTSRGVGPNRRRSSSVDTPARRCTRLARWIRRRCHVRNSRGRVPSAPTIPDLKSTPIGRMNRRGWCWFWSPSRPSVLNLSSHRRCTRICPTIGKHSRQFSRIIRSGFNFHM